MKNSLKLEEFGILLLGFFLFMQLELLPFWWYFVLLLSPDIGMIGYLFGKKSGCLYV